MESIYALGLLGASIPLEIACVLLFLAPVILLLLPRALAQRVEEMWGAKGLEAPAEASRLARLA
ncbi:MAG TPA: hypothetical protein PKW05_11655 [Anaerolineae bacterium]|nr:hypothetical protein [Anaerolineae bacterium]